MTTNERPLASLSLDADNIWAYQMTHGDPGWQSYPTYLPTLAERVLPVLAARDLTITFFVVGQDAALEVNQPAIASLAAAGHEIGNHSFRHQPWLHRYRVAEIHEELARAEDAIEEVTGQHTIGFRGPGYSLSPAVIKVLADRGYLYDCSTLPTVIGPLARWYYFRSAHLDAAQREERAHLFGDARDGLRPVHPYTWDAGGRALLEIPVTTMPLVRVPIHVSYVLYLASVAPALGVAYFRAALRVCRLRGVEPSILLHPLDFLGADDVDSLRFFPGMAMTGAAKRAVVERCLDVLAEGHRVVTMRDHAAALSTRALPSRSPSASMAGEHVA